MSIRTTSVAKRGRKRMEDGCAPQRCYRARIARRDVEAEGYERQYACPFMARDPTCSDCVQGYSSIPRVKEHLRRRHVPSTPSVLCPRCFAEFKEPAERWEHFRNITPCELASEPPARLRDCISKETSDALNRRTKRCESPEESWRHIYRTIYPDTPEHDIPSPYLDSVSYYPIHNYVQATPRSPCTTSTISSSALCEGITHNTFYDPVLMDHVSSTSSDQSVSSLLRPHTLDEFGFSSYWQTFESNPLMLSQEQLEEQDKLLKDCDDLFPDVVGAGSHLHEVPPSSTWIPLHS